MTVDAEGQLWCAVSPHARFSYLGDPDKTAAAWRHTLAGPAFTVADVGRIDADGYVFLDGRRDDAMPDQEWGQEWGQRVCAAVVGRPTSRLFASTPAPYSRPRCVPRPTYALRHCL